MDLADLIFGPDSHGSTLEERARTSSRIFIRSQDHLAEYSETAKGRQLSAWEALKTFGFDILREVVEYGSAILPAATSEPSETLRKRRENLGFSLDELANFTGLELENVIDAENPNTRTPIRMIEKIAQVLALDEHTISFLPEAGGDETLAVRLRELKKDQPTFSSRSVAQLCESAWVIKKQNQLNDWLYPNGYSSWINKGFGASTNYGSMGYPAWKHGYYLANNARELLGIPPDKPIESLRELIEDILRIAVVQIELPTSLAGATVASGSARGIAVNIRGENENVWIRRVTLAHELGHLLWDPDENLKSLKVDNYSDLVEDPLRQKDYVEARANAFAIEFIAPQKSTIDLFKSALSPSIGLRSVMETFGLSFTSAKHHILNGLDQSISPDELTVDDCNPLDEWKARESFTVDYFKPASVPISRRGLFARLVWQATNQGLLTQETASSYLGCEIEEYSIAADFLSQLY